MANNKNETKKTKWQHDQLALYVEEAKRNEEAQNTDFDLVVLQEEIYKNAEAEEAEETETVGLAEDFKEDAKSLVNDFYEAAEETAGKAVKKFNSAITVYNNGDNALICYMLFIIIILLFLNLFLD